MSISRWMTLAAAVMVLGALGGGIGAARQQGSEPVKKDVQAQPPSAANPVRKALQDALDGIKGYEEKLKVALATIEKQHSEILALKARIDALESRDKAAAIKGPNPDAVAKTKRQAPGNDPADAEPVAHLPLPDFITTYPGGILSRSAKGDRILIFATKTGTVRSYRPPRGAHISQATVWQRYILIMSDGPGATQLAAYDLDHDRWAIQDLRDGIKGIFNSFIRQGASIGLMATSFQGSPLTQLAIFDLKRFRWSVQDLIEPLDERYANPIAYGNVAIYVLGRHIYAYSAEAGRWDVLTLNEPFIIRGIAGEGPHVTNDSAAVSQEGRLHVFTAATGRWQTIDPKD